MNATANNYHAIRAQAILSESRIPELRGILVRSDGDELVLNGRVSTFYHKQLAQELIWNELDYAAIRNRIEVSDTAKPKSNVAK